MDTSLCFGFRLLAESGKIGARRWRLPPCHCDDGNVKRFI
jgi:hypothetical protein